jgi:hypothetical protein
MSAVSNRTSPLALAVGALTIVLAMSTTQLHAQLVEPDPSEAARVRYGAWAFTPALVFSFGHDSNVYREPIGFSDTELFVVPQIEGWWVRPGSRTTVNAAVEVVRFGRNIGATNSQFGIRWDRTGSLVRPFVGLNRRNTNANPTGFEVGYKSLRLENDLVTGAAFSVSRRTQLRFQGRLTQTRYDADAIYQGSSLREKLNRNTAGISTGLSYVLTPLTAIGGTVDVSRDRFIFSPVRDGDTLRILGHVEFAKPALLFGSASVGHMNFSSPASQAADFSGLIGAINLGYARGEGTLVRFLMSRDFQYSFDSALNYYLLNSLNVGVSHRFGQHWDTAAFANWFSGDYRPAGSVAGIGRVDRLSEFGGAIAYRVGRWTRIGASAERARKDAPAEDWEAVRVVGFLTYGSGRFQRLDRPTPFER